MRMMGVAAVVAVSFGRQFFRNAINNGLPVVECDIADIAENDEIAVDLETGRITIPSRGIARSVPPLPREVQAILAAGGLIAFLQQHPQWELA
jgi:3-isopropylmalate dehydratase small subunit